MPEPARRSRFVPVVASGVLAAALAAVASARPWAEGSDLGASADHAALIDAGLPGSGAGEMPLAAALSLVVLACWGVLLVTRGVVRRAVAVLAVLAALGLAATVVIGFGSAQDDVLESLRETGVPSDTLSATLTPWYYLSAVATVVLVVAGLAAVRLCPTWPEMGSRYDAPGSTGAGRDGVPAGELRERPHERQSSHDLWKQLDEGRDPTA